MKTNNVRVRFAPSPTGCFHIGSARTALYNWLYARSYSGVFVLRIEDTDFVRNTKPALKKLLDGMRWLGLDWDEGPFFQSNRTKIYNFFLKELFEKKRAYKKNGAIYFSLEGKRYYLFDKYRNTLIEKVKNNPITINDSVRGYVTHIVEEDFILRRSNGNFGFNFVNVVDDITMKITHVIRGEDHLSNTARHIELYRALGLTPPIYTHLPLILNRNESGKMSKRKSGSLIDKDIKCHYLPEAVRNFICLLGWSPKDNREVIPIEDIINKFSIEKIQKKSAFFDIKKLSHINTVYLRSLSRGKFYSAAYPILAEKGLIKDDTPERFVYHVLDLAQKKAINLENLQILIDFFFIENFFIEKQKIINCRPIDCLCEALYALSNLNDWGQKQIESTINTLSFTHKQKKQYYFTNLRMAVSGKSGGIDLIPLLVLMGKKRTLIRIRYLLKEEEVYSSSF